MAAPTGLGSHWTLDVEIDATNGDIANTTIGSSQYGMRTPLIVKHPNGDLLKLGNTGQPVAQMKLFSSSDGGYTWSDESILFQHADSSDSTRQWDLSVTPNGDLVVTHYIYDNDIGNQAIQFWVVTESAGTYSHLSANNYACAQVATNSLGSNQFGNHVVFQNVAASSGLGADEDIWVVTSIVWADGTYQVQQWLSDYSVNGGSINTSKASIANDYSGSDLQPNLLFKWSYDTGADTYAGDPFNATFADMVIVKNAANSGIGIKAHPVKWNSSTSRYDSDATGLRTINGSVNVGCHGGWYDPVEDDYYVFYGDTNTGAAVTWGFYKSTDHGASWTALTAPTFDLPTGYGLYNQIAIQSTVRGRKVYLGAPLYHSTSVWRHFLYSYDMDSETWTEEDLSAGSSVSTEDVHFLMLSDDFDYPVGWIKNASGYYYPARLNTVLLPPNVLGSSGGLGWGWIPIGG